MTVASQIGYDITDKNYKNKDVTQDHKKAKLFQAMKAEQHVINDSNKHAGKALPLKSNDPRAIFEEEEASSDVSDEEQYTDIEDEDEEPSSYEEEYMDEVETLIRMEERLEKLKQQGEEDGIEEKIAEVKKSLQELLSRPFKT